MFSGKREEDGSKKKKAVEKLKKILTKRRFQESVRSSCRDRDYEWRMSVLGRVEFVRNCRAVVCKYHNACFTNFCSGKRKQKKFFSPRKLQKAGRPEDQVRDGEFCELVDEIKNNIYESLSVSDCIKIMEANLLGTNSEAYGPTHVRTGLKEYFKGNIRFYQQERKSDVVMLNSSTSKLLHDFHLESEKKDKNEENLRVFRTAARLLSDITSLNIDSDWYPGISTLGDLKNMDCLPESLTCFLRTLMCGKKNDIKTARLGQAIAQASRHRSALLPMQFGVAVHAHRALGSRGLAEILSKFGFCSSYNQVKQCESSNGPQHSKERE